MAGVAGLLAVARPAGLIPYAEGLRLQREAHARRRAGTGPDTVILLEHRPVVTLGPRTGAGDLLVPEETLRARGVELHRTDRGGGITWHGPGQVVAYPILDLRSWGLRPRDHLRFLEEVVVEVLARFGLRGGTEEGRTGVWVDGSKVCALGVRVEGGVSLHGLALNVTTSREAFAGIIPCGIVDAGVTSMHGLLRVEVVPGQTLDSPPSVEDVMDALEEIFRREARRQRRLP